MDETPSTSSAQDMFFDDEFKQRICRLPIDKIKENLALFELDSHPILRTDRRQIERNRQFQLERIELHRERAEQRAKEELDTRENFLRNQTDTRSEEIHEECIRRAEEMERAYEHEYSIIDITKAPATPIVYEANKKTLRGRGGGQLIEPITYFNSHQSNRIPEFKVEMGFNNEKIRRNLDSIANRPETRRKPSFTVTVQKPKLTIENKTFKHGEDVYVWTNTFGDVLARLEIISEKTIILKANHESEQKVILKILMKGTNSWDNRQVTATVEDLEDGRVIITKQKDKEKGQ